MQKSATSLTMRAMRTLFITLALVGFGCGDSGTKPVDATVTPPIDTPAVTPPLALDCGTYCTQIATACPGALQQFGGTTAADVTAHCMSTCATFPLGAQADTSGNTLGCRNYHIQNITVKKMGADVHCPHTGPLGTTTNGTATCGDACTNFCSTEIAACGSLDAPKTGIPAQYQNTAACMTACAGFDKTHQYTITGAAAPTTNPGGDSLACRMYHATNAAITGNQVVHCPHTQATATGPCMGPATP